MALQAQHVVKLIVTVVLVEGYYKSPMIRLESVIRIGYAGDYGREINRLAEVITHQKLFEPR